jgi:hypothetical protein
MFASFYLSNKNEFKECNLPAAGSVFTIQRTTFVKLPKSQPALTSLLIVVIRHVQNFFKVRFRNRISILDKDVLYIEIDKNSLGDEFVIEIL